MVGVVVGIKAYFGVGFKAVEIGFCDRCGFQTEIPRKPGVGFDMPLRFRDPLSGIGCRGVAHIKRYFTARRAQERKDNIERGFCFVI